MSLSLRFYLGFLIEQQEVHKVVVWTFSKESTWWRCGLSARSPEGGGADFQQEVHKVEAVDFQQEPSDSLVWRTKAVNYLLMGAIAFGLDGFLLWRCLKSLAVDYTSCHSACAWSTNIQRLGLVVRLEDSRRFLHCFTRPVRCWGLSWLRWSLSGMRDRTTLVVPNITLGDVMSSGVIKDLTEDFSLQNRR